MKQKPNEDQKMSCQIANEKLVATVADYIAYLLTNEYVMPNEVANAVKAAFPRTSPVEIYEDLYRVNFAAYDGRYGASGEHYHGEYRKQLGADFRNEKAVFVRLYNAFCFLSYQCAENATIEGPVYKALEKIEGVLAVQAANYAVHSLGLKWGVA